MCHCQEAAAALAFWNGSETFNFLHDCLECFLYSFCFFFLPCYFSLKLRCFARMPASSGFDFLGLLVVSLEDGQVDEAPPPPQMKKPKWECVFRTTRYRLSEQKAQSGNWILCHFRHVRNERLEQDAQNQIQFEFAESQPPKDRPQKIILMIFLLKVFI